jgi:hypothetical protein
VTYTRDEAKGVLMHKVCPQCQGTFETQFLCPHCGIQLLEVPDRSAVIHGAADDPQERMLNIGRQLLAALVLAQGLYFALRQAATGLALTGLLREPEDLFVMIGLQVIAALAGGLVAGAGNPRGLAAGAAIGVIHGMILVCIHYGLGNKPADVFLFVVWVPNAIVGAIGGFIGRRYWPSVHDLPDPSRVVKVKPKKVKKDTGAPVPLGWLRILGGAALAIGCAVWAGRIRDTIIGMGAGAFSLDSQIQSKFIAWVITTLAMMIGGAFAGIGARGGARQGFLVGLLASLGIFIVHREVVQEVLPAEQFFVAIFGLPEAEELSMKRTVLFLLTNTLLIGVLAGWMGGLLFPRLGERRTQPLDHASI